MLPCRFAALYMMKGDGSRDLMIPLSKGQDPVSIPSAVPPPMNHLTCYFYLVFLYVFVLYIHREDKHSC